MKLAIFAYGVACFVLGMSFQRLLLLIMIAQNAG